MRLSFSKLIPLVLITICMASLVWGDSDGPPDEVAGACGYQYACNKSGCHDDGRAYLTWTSFSIDVTPSEYGPGDTLDVAVSLNYPGQQRWGFEVTMGNGICAPTGGFLVTDPARTQVSIGADGHQYIKQTALGSDSGAVDASPGWSFKYVVPSPIPPGVVNFFGAACAADGDGTRTGDSVFTTWTSVQLQGDCFIPMVGDVNNNGSITSADIIYMVGFIFKNGPAPLPCTATGDWNCSGTVTAADVLHLVIYVFRGSDWPCDVCNLIPDVWTCP